MKKYMIYTVLIAIAIIIYSCGDDKVTNTKKEVKPEQELIDTIKGRLDFHTFIETEQAKNDLRGMINNCKIYTEYIEYDNLFMAKINMSDFIKNKSTIYFLPIDCFDKYYGYKIFDAMESSYYKDKCILYYSEINECLYMFIYGNND